MTSLTQIDISCLEEVSSDVTKTIVAYHRLHRISAVYSLGQNQFDFFECKSIFELRWQRLGSWKVIDEFKTIIGVLALESYDVFAFIGNSNNGTDILLIAFDGKVRLRQTISQRKDAVCVDYNQKTRDFFIGYENGSLMCVFTNCSAKFEYSLTVKRVIKVHSEKSQPPKQILTQDFMGLLFILTNEGNILCIDGTKFELVYSISRTAFSLIPSRVYCDKFGTDFLVRLHNSEKSKEQLECWHPPEDYASCRAGRFERFVIPLTAPIVGLSFESVGLYSGRTLLEVFTRNKKLQLWSCFGSTSVNLEAEITLNIPPGIWKQYFAIFGSDILQQISQNTIKDSLFINLDYYSSISSHMSSLQENLKFSSILLTNICQLATAIGIHLPDKKDTELNMQYIDMEISKYGVAVDQEDLSQFQQQALPIPRQFTYNSDDESSIMSETLIGALSNLAEVNRSIDERISQSQSLTNYENQTHNDSLSSVQLTNEVTFEDTISIAPQYPNLHDVTLSGVRRDSTVPSAPLSSRDLPSFLVSPQAGVAPPSQPDFSTRKLSAKPSNLSDLMLSDYNALQSKPAPYRELAVIKFVPTFFLHNQDTCKCDPNYSNPYSMVRFLEPDGMLMNDYYRLFAFSHEGLSPLIPEMSEKKLEIKFHSLCYRSGFLSVVSNQKDCLIYDMRNINISPVPTASVPLRVVLTIKNHVKVTAVASADIFLRTPPLPSTHATSGGHLKKKDKSSSSGNKDQFKFSEPVLSKYLMIVVGDSDGYIHIYISDSNHTILQTESFLAHQSASIKQILFTGDATRSLWQVGIDYLPGSNKLVLQTLGGSSILTASSEGEVKVWQPFSMEMNLHGSKSGAATISSSVEKFFQCHHIRWKISGVFVVDRTYSIQHCNAPANKMLTQPNTSANSRNSSKPPTAPGSTSKKFREMVSMTLLPSCLNLLISFSNGTIEEWNIPGLLDTNEATLATSQKEIWSNFQSHSEDIISARVYVHGPLSTIKQVHFIHDHERDSMLAKLATFVRIPNRMKTTIGLSFQEMKLLAISSSLTTCSKDSSIVLWGFNSSFFGHCSYLIPVPVRKFYFSSSPAQGLCYALSITNGQYHLGNVNWKVDAIINGKVQSVVFTTRDSLFGSLLSMQTTPSNTLGKAAEMLTDYRADYGHKKAFIRFEDEIIDPFGSKDDVDEVSEFKNKMVMGIPVISPVFKAQYLVNGYQVYNSIYDPFRLGVIPSAEQNFHDVSAQLIQNPILLSTNLLEEWGKVEPVSHNPVISTVHVTDRPPTAVKSSVREMDSSIIPEFIENSHRSYDEYLADISSRPRSNLSSRGDSAFRRTRSLSPVIVKVPSFDRLENLKEAIESEGDDDGMMSGRKKVLVQGIMVEVESNLDLKEFEQSIQNRKFVLERTPPVSPEKPLIPLTKGEKILVKESRNETPVDGEQAKLLQTPKKVSENKKLGVEEDGDAKSAVSERTRLSIAAVSFTKDSKVVRTISFDADEVVADTISPEKADDETSVTSDITQDEPKKPHKGLALNKAMELRQKMQEQLKERLELREKRGSNIYGGDARQTLKKVYTSKTSLQKQDLLHIQKGAKQPTSNAAINNLPPSRVIIQRPGIKGNSESPTKLQEYEDLRTIRQTVPPPTKYVVVKQKDDTATKLTHQLIVAKTKYYKERSSRNGDESEGSLSGNGFFYESDENIGAANSDNRIEFEDESNSQLDLDSTGFSLSIDTNVRLEDGFKKDNDSPSRRKSPLALSENNTIKSPVLAAMNIPAVLAKTQSLEIDLPDLRKDKRRKYALAISQNMSLRNLERADELANIISKTAIFDEENEDLDDVSIVTHYFDRNAKPIFVDRGKPPKQVLKKRNQKVGKGMGSRSRSGDEDDGEWIEDENAIQEMNATLLDMYLDELSPEERKMFENLDEEAKQKLLRELRMQMGAGKRKNNKTKDLFKKLTKMATEQARLHAILSMELTLETTEVTDETLSVSITTNQKGPIAVVLTYSKNRFTPTKEDFYSSASILSLPGYLEHRSIVFDRDNFEEITFRNLHPETSYTVFAAVDKSNHAHFPMTDEVNEEEEEEKNKLIKPPKSITLKSLEEKLEIEWNRLDLEQRTIELRAAIRSEFVQMKSFYNYPIILLPTDEEILESNFQTLISPTISENDYHTLKSQRFQSNSSLKHIPTFLDWWIGHSKVTSKTRSSFHEIEAFYATLNKKIQKSMEEDRLFSNTREMNTLIEFSKSNIKHRARLNREVDPEDNLLLAGIPQINAESTDLSDERLSLFKRFRSWYKGGFVIKEKEIKLARLQSGSGSTRSIVSPISSPKPVSISRVASFTLSKSRSSDSKDNQNNVEALLPEHSQFGDDNVAVSIVTSQKRRLQERTIFLRMLLEPVDVCTRQIQKLYEQYGLVKSMAFRLNDLSTSRRNSITSKDANAIMSAKKFLDLCIVRHMLSKNVLKYEEEPFPDISLNTLNPFNALKRTKSEAAVAITPKTLQKTYPIPMVIQRIAGVDLFRPVHVNTLKPDEPPPLALKCLPGTTRRPNKPWQSLSKQEQELEMTLACALDSIWELAVIDNVPVPNPEDRLLSSTEFPLKALIWENFRKWYAGEEEIDPIPGQGVPTVARVIFSEQLEMPQVERDSFVADMMEDQAFPLPLSYYSKNGDTSARSNRGESEENGNSSDLDERDEDETNLIEDVFSASKSKSSVRSMRQAYEKAISAAAGAQIRSDLMVELLSHYLHSRLMNMMKYLWPPGLKRMGLQYLYPRSLSFYYPKFSLPLHRFHLFPSRSRVTYNREEILAWYNVLEMQEDDQLMVRAEKKGVKQRAYHEWLTLEPQRQIYSRTQMAIEDSIAYQHRELHLLLEKRWKHHEERLTQLDEDIDTGEYNPKDRTRTKTSMLNLTPREMRSVKQNLVSDLAEEDDDTEISENDEDQNENNSDDLSIEGPEDKKREDREDEIKKEEKILRGKKLESRGNGRAETASSSAFSSPRYPTKSPRLINITPRTDMSREYSEIAFPATESTTHEPVSGIPPAVQNLLSPELLDSQTEEFKAYISEHLSTIEQDELSTALAMFDRARGIGGLQTTPINEELAANFINSNQMNFRVLNNLPQEYWYIFEESFEFKNGSGIYNDDEVEAERLLQEERARKAIDDALEFQRILEFEKKKREQEELARLRREEQDRRLREGMVRRRKLREHLEELKQQRTQRRKEEEEARLKAIEDERLAKVEEEQRIALEKYLQFLEEERCREISLMESEEIYMRDLKVRHRELKFMEHEDILSFLVEQMNVQYEMAEKERIKELEELYTPFEPYQFKQSRLPALERVLTYADDLNYDEEASFGEDEEYLQSLDGGKSSYSLVTSPSSKHAISSNISPSKRKNEKLLARMPPAELPYSNTGRSLDFNSPTKTKKKKFNTLPIPSTHDPSIISFQSIVKQDHPTTMNQKMNHMKNTDVKTSDHQPTKKKIRKFFDITKLSVENLSKPLNASIHIDNTKSIIQRTDGDLSDPYPIVPAVFPHSPAKVDSAKEKIEEIVKTAPILPFNPYDTQWELQKSPPLTLSNLPFFIRPSSHGLNPFRSHSEQALSTPNLVLPLSSHSRSRPFSATSPGLQLKSASNRGFGSSKPNSSTGGRLLSPIDLNSLQNPEIAIPVPNSLTGEDNRLSSVGSRSSYSPLSLEREKDRDNKPNFHVQIAIKEELTPTHDPGSSPTSGRQRQIIDDSDLASHHTKQTMETYESEYNKTTEVTVDYINSLLAETKEKTKHENEILARYSEDELQFIQSLASSKSLHLGSKAYHQNPLLAGDALSSASLSLEKQVVGAGLGETSLQTSLNKSKVAKNAVSLVPEMVEKTNSQKEWLEYLSLQQKLTTASLSTIDTQEKEKLKKILGRGGILPISAQLANQTIKLPSKQRNDVKPSIKSKKKAGEILSSTMPNLSSSPSKGTGLSTSASTSAIKFQNSAIGLDYKTFQLAQTASEEVIRLKEQKELLKQYISGHAMLEEEQNEYYLLACQPGIQSQTILQKNASVQKFAQEIDEFLKNSDHTKGVSATVTAVNTAESVVGSEDDENTITTAGGGGAADKGEDEEDDYRARSNATSPTSLNSRKKKSKSLIYQPTSVGISSIPPPLAKKPFLSTSTSKLLTQVVPSTLTAHVTPLLSRKDPVPVQKKRSQPPIQMSSAEAAMEARENEEAALLKATSALNPFIMGNKITIAKESKKDILAKSKQLLLSSNNNASNKSSTNALPPKPTIRAFVRPNITVNTSNDDSSSAHNKSTSTPQSGMYESSVELKTGRSLDLFIRTPRVDGKSLELENHHTSDSHDEVGLVGSVELERSASDLSSFNHQLPDEEKSITA